MEDQERSCLRNASSFVSQNISWNDFKKMNELFLLSSTDIYIFSAFRILVILVGFVGNLVLLIKVLRRPRDQTRPYDVFVASMSVVHLISLSIGESVVILTNFSMGQWLWGDILCKIFKFGFVSPYFFVMIFQVLLSVDRLIKVSFSDRALPCLLITTKKAKLFSGVVWITGTGLSLYALFTFHTYTASFGTCVYTLCHVISFRISSEIGIFYSVNAVIFLPIPYVLVLIMNILILKSLFAYSRRQRKLRRENKLSSSPALKDIRAIKTVLASSFVLLICWSIFVVISMFDVFDNVHEVTDKAGRLFGISYTAIIPFVYGSSYSKLFRNRLSPISTRDNARTTDNISE